MRTVVLLLLATLLLSSTAAAQFVSRPGFIHEARPTEGSVTLVEIHFFDDPQSKFRPLPRMPSLVAGYDNVLNLTVTNGRPVAVNATFLLNVSGATVSPNEIRLEIPAHALVGQTFVVHSDDVGVVKISAEATDAFQTSGEPLQAEAEAPALRLPSMRFLDPPTLEVDEDDEFQQVEHHYGPAGAGTARIRIPPGQAIAPRLELTNPFETTIAGFLLTLGGANVPKVEVPAIEAGATHVVEFDEYTPIEESYGAHYGGGPMGSFLLYPVVETTIGGAGVTAGGRSFRVDRGAILDVLPVAAQVDVQDGLAIDLFVPKAPVLGAPTRVKYNLTNLATTPVEGPLLITLTTPHRLFYEVQGPETYLVQVSLAGGERRSGAVEFTPRVTGAWVATTYFRSPEGFGFGSGGGFDVNGPVVIGFDRTDQVFARIGEPVDIGIVLVSSDTVNDAQLRIGSGSQYYRDPSTTSGSSYRPGFMNGLVESRTATSSLGTLRPGGAVNASIEVFARAAGSYNIVPYVVAEGFAYTSTIQRDPQTQQPIDVGMPLSASMLNFIAQPRAVPPGLSLAPLTLGLAFFVGVWTFRTKFVR